MQPTIFQRIAFQHRVVAAGAAVRITLIALAVLAATWLATIKGQEVYYAKPPYFTCSKPAQECAMDRANCLDGSCDDILRAAGAK